MSMQILSGHNAPETAYIIDDYPYGFRLRCQMRCWIETTKHGQRFVTQTSNPKKAGLVWNKPKLSTYSDLAVMYLDEQGHIQHAGFPFAYRDEEELDAFISTYGAALTGDYYEKQIKLARAIFRARQHFTVKIVAPGEERTGESATAEDMRRAVAYEYNKLEE